MKDQESPFEAPWRAAMNPPISFPKNQLDSWPASKLWMPDVRRLLSAVLWASAAHAKQLRKDGQPYIIHPIDVCMATITMMETSIDSIELPIAAVLHDVVEDTLVDLPHVKYTWGSRVAGLVEELTGDKKLSHEKRVRIAIEHAKTLSRGARIIKMGDRYSNLKDGFGQPAKWVKRYCKESRELITNLTDPMKPINEMFRRYVEQAISFIEVLEGRIKKK